MLPVGSRIGAEQGPLVGEPRLWAQSIECSLRLHPVPLNKEKMYSVEDPKDDLGRERWEMPAGMPAEAEKTLAPHQQYGIR
jgi:hypothetical protein